MSYVGDIRLGDTIDIKFTTRQISGAPFTLAGSPVISAYVGNGTTEITAGITLSVDFDSRTGLNNVRVAATSGNGFATATNVQLVITTGTVNSVSVVGEVIGSFSIEARSALMPTTGGRTLVVDAAGLADANMVKAGPTGAGTAQTARDIGGAVPAAAAGASGGLLISGSNAGTTTFGALTVTGATTLTGAVSLGSTLGVTGTTTFAAINTGAIGTGTITTTGNWSVSGTVTLTGAVTANNAGNAITGVTAALTGDLTATMKTSVTTAATAATPTAAAVTGAVGSVTAAVTVGTNNDKTGYTLSSAGVDAVWDKVITGTTTAVQAMRGFLAAMLGKASGLNTTTAVYRNVADSKDVITATVDADGNRTAVTLDLA